MKRARVAPCAVPAISIPPLGHSDRGEREVLDGAYSFPLAPKFATALPSGGAVCVSIKAQQAPEHHLGQPRCPEAPRLVIGEHPSQGEKLYVH